jgi:glutaredoxin
VKYPKTPYWTGVLRLRVPLRLLGLSVLLIATLVGCAKSEESAPQDQGPTSTEPIPGGLPPLELKDDTPNLLLTWLDAEGDFHVVQAPADVPAEARSQVRVVITDKVEGTGQTVYVADLSKQDDQGRYSVITMPRSQWNELGAKRRKVRMEAMAAPTSSAASSAALAQTAGEVSAIIYGADWCKPCHDAENFLKRLGVNVTKKDIEKSRAANAEMQAKLSKAGRGGASIPVIEVAGKLFVGFNPSVLQQVVSGARKPELL